MTTWQNFLEKKGHPPEWPYPIDYDQEQEIEADVLIIGGGIAGCWAAISAARNGVKVALVEKGATIRSGAGGPGCDHWCDVPANPLSKVNPDEWAQRLSGMPYSNGIGREIQCRESYDTLVELENMGGKIRDIGDEFVGAEGRDDASKFMISPRFNQFHDTNVVIRVWGTTFKPALRKECKRLGVDIYDRVMVTSLLTEGGVQGSRVIGATGINNRTGGFMVFRSKSTILTTAGFGPVWLFNSELAGINTMSSRNSSGDGYAMAWKAGAELTLMERSSVLRNCTGYKHAWYTGASDASYENVRYLDNNGKMLPFVSEPSWGISREMTDRTGLAGHWLKVREGIYKGEYNLPFYGDFPGMEEIERNVIWKLMLGEESKTKIITNTFEESGFDPSKDMMMLFNFIEGDSPPHWRLGSGGLMIDWDLKSSLDGLYAAGMQVYSPGDHSFAASTGRYAGRKAAEYAKQVDEAIPVKDQISLEKERIYAPIKRKEGMDWKEMHAGVARVMQYFCGEYKTDTLFNIGLGNLKEIEERWVPRLCASDPHKLMRCLEDLTILTSAEIILQACLARKASSKPLGFQRIDYPELDPPEWAKFLTVRLENDEVKVGEYPLDYFGNLKENYEARNKGYNGIYKG